MEESYVYRLAIGYQLHSQETCLPNPSKSLLRYAEIAMSTIWHWQYPVLQPLLQISFKHLKASIASHKRKFQTQENQICISSWALDSDDKDARGWRVHCNSVSSKGLLHGYHYIFWCVLCKKTNLIDTLTVFTVSFSLPAWGCEGGPSNP